MGLRMRAAMLGVAVAFACVSAMPAFPEQPTPAMSAEEKAYLTKMEALAKSLHPQTGDVSLDAAKATLHLGKDYYFLDADESRKVIVDAWGNPSEQAEGVLGMVFPAGKSFLDPNSWGAIISYEQGGHVADDDAASADFDALMEQMKEGEAERNEARKKEGYAPIHLVGWADRPAYNRASHSVVWARELQFGDSSEHSLNYDVRLLGRVGVLSLNMVSGMSHLPEIKAAAAKFAAAATFDKNFAYSDYVDGVDEAAGYGIGGLVAAGVGIAAVKKLGLLALALAFGKKFMVLLLVGAAAVWQGIKRMFGGKAADDAFVEDAIPEATQSDDMSQLVAEGPSSEPPPER